MKISASPSPANQGAGSAVASAKKRSGSIPASSSCKLMLARMSWSRRWALAMPADPCDRVCARMGSISATSSAVSASAARLSSSETPASLLPPRRDEALEEDVPAGGKLNIDGDLVKPEGGPSTGGRRRRGGERGSLLR